MKSLFDVSWQVDEPTYRADEALSYSMLSKFDREGFKALSTLFDPISTPSLLFGSLVDTLLTNPSKFSEEFIIVSEVNISDSVKTVLEDIYATTKQKSLVDVPDEVIHHCCKKNNYYIDDKWAAKRKKEILLGVHYYNLLHKCEGKKVISKELYDEALACKKALCTNPETSKYFMPDPEGKYENFYQLKFKGEYQGISLRCMFDCLHIDYENKIITPIDLKTTSKMEYEFPQSFITYRYGIQAQLYYYLLTSILIKDEYFKDFKVEPFKFIVINKDSLLPLVWEFKQSANEGYTLGDYTFKSWTTLAYELNFYLRNKPKLPIWAKETNSIEDYFKINKSC